jgi:hypothetical protein
LMMEAMSSSETPALNKSLTVLYPGSRHSS